MFYELIKRNAIAPSKWNSLQMSARRNRLETARSIPALKTLMKIAEVLEVSIDALVYGQSEEKEDVNVQDKTLLEKVKLIEELDENQKNSLFTFIDTAIANKRLKDALNNAINIAS